MTLFHWLISTIAVLVAAYLVPGVDVDLIGALVLAVVLGLFNAFLRPLVNLLTLPLNIVTLGLFSLVTNAVIIMVADYLIPGFTVGGFWAALVFSVLLSLINWLFTSARRA